VRRHRTLRVFRYPHVYRWVLRIQVVVLVFRYAPRYTAVSVYGFIFKRRGTDRPGRRRLRHRDVLSETVAATFFRTYGRWRPALASLPGPILYA